MWHRFTFIGNEGITEREKLQLELMPDAIMDRFIYFEQEPDPELKAAVWLIIQSQPGFIKACSCDRINNIQIDKKDPRVITML